MCWITIAKSKRNIGAIRLPDNRFAPTGNKAHKIRVTGYLMWDDEHNKSDTDVGLYIGWFSKRRLSSPMALDRVGNSSGAENRRSRNGIIATLDSLGRLDYECAT